jgi:hypothetical protein
MGEFMTGYLSEVGHNNFYYPSNTKILLDEKYLLSSQKMNWIGGNHRNLIPYKVKRTTIKPLTIDEHYVNVIVNNDSEFVVVWLNKETLTFDA